MAKTIDLKNIGWPALFIRTAPDDTHVADLLDVIKGSEKDYPFDDPILVRKLDKPAKYTVTMAGKGGTCEYELVKGLHRCLALQLGKINHAMADVQSFSDPGSAFFAQYDDHGVLKVSVADRARFIKELRTTYKWTVEQVAAKMGVSTASVSRISRNLQATGGSGKPRKGRKKKKEKGEAAEATTEAVTEFSVPQWYVVLGQLVDAYKEYSAAVLGFVGTVDPSVIVWTVTMADDLLAAAKAVKA